MSELFWFKNVKQELRDRHKGLSKSSLTQRKLVLCIFTNKSRVDVDFHLLEEISQMPWLNWAAANCDKQITEAQDEAKFSPYLPSFSEVTEEDFLTLYGFGLF